MTVWMLATELPIILAGCLAALTVGRYGDRKVREEIELREIDAWLVQVRKGRRSCDWAWPGDR